MTVALPRGALAALLLALCSQSAGAQGWGVDVYAGGTSYDALVGRVASTNAIGNVRYQSRAGDLAYLSLAAPLDASAVFWSTSGAAIRRRTRPVRAWALGVEAAAHGYLFRDTESHLSGGGATLHAIPHLIAQRNRFALEVRGGAHEHLFSLPDTSGSRRLFELGLRASVGAGFGSAIADFRWLRAPGTSFPYAGVQVSHSRGRARVWGWAGKWLADDLDGAEWGVGGGVTVPRVGELWLSVRQDAGDPLVQTGERQAWNLGLSRQLGSPRSSLATLAPRVESGRVRIQLPASEVSANSGAPSVAGEFSEWKPTSMRREGAQWVLDLPLASGVYRFAFVSGSGEWFVPDGYPGRVDDGMSGHVAVMVVP